MIVSAGLADLDYCRSLGATVALDYRAKGLAQALQDAAPDGVDVYRDTSGHHDLTQAIELLAVRGRIVVLSGMAARPELPVGPLYVRDGRLLGFAISNAHASELAAAATRVNQLLGDGSLAARRVQVLPLASAGAGGLGGVPEGGLWDIRSCPLDS